MSDSGKPGVTIKRILIKPEMDLIEAIEKDDRICQAIRIGDDFKDPNRTNKAKLLKAKLIELLVASGTFPIVPTRGPNQPRIEVEIIKFEIGNTQFLQGEEFRQACVKVKMSLITAHNVLLQSVYRQYTPIFQNKLGELPKSKDEIDKALVEVICRKMIKAITFSYEDTYRYYENGNLTVNKGVRLAFKKKNLKGAMKIWDNELEKNQDNHAAAYNLGIGYEFYKKYELALEMYEKAVDLSPNNKHYVDAFSELEKELENRRLLKKVKLSIN